MSEQHLPLSTQENLLVLCCFNDDAAKIIRNTVEVPLWGNPLYRVIVERVYDFIDRYKVAPADHTPDLLEDKVRKGDSEAQAYVEILTAIDEHRNSVKVEYTLNQMHSFVEAQTLTQTVIEAGEALQDGHVSLDERLERVREVLDKGARKRIIHFSPGVRLSQMVGKVFAREVRANVTPTGIKELDKWDLGCADGELHLYLAGPKTGKSWWLLRQAKNALLQGQRVVYLTLELSDAQISQRFLQMLFAIQQHKLDVPVTRIHEDDAGRLLRFEPDMLGGCLSLDEPSNETLVERRLGGLHTESNLIIKQFPAGQLDVRGLRSYLDMLERTENFVPHKLVLDYPKYMKLDPRNYRLEYGALTNDLRGLAVERQMGVYIAGELNREGMRARQARAGDSGEDISRVYTADTILVFSRTEAEEKLGLARLFADSTRVAGRDKFTVLMSQAYQIGQYCLDSTLMRDTYAGLMESAQQAQEQRQSNAA